MGGNGILSGIPKLWVIVILTQITPLPDPNDLY